MKKGISVLVILTGVLSIIFSIVTFNSDISANWKYGESAKFGADFYTIVNKNAEASAYTVVALEDAAEIVRNFAGFCLLIAGILITLGGFWLLNKVNSENSAASQPPAVSLPKNDKLAEAMRKAGNEKSTQLQCPFCGEAFQVSEFSMQKETLSCPLCGKEFKNIYNQD